MALGSTIPLIVIQKIVPRIISKMGDLNKLSSLLLSKCNNLPLHIKCNDPRINDIKNLLARIQKLIKSLKKLTDSLNKVIKTLNGIVIAATIIKVVQLAMPPLSPPGVVAEVLEIVNKLLQNIKSAAACFIALIDIIKLAINLCNDAMAQTLITLGSVCNAESFTITSDVKQLIDSNSARLKSNSKSNSNSSSSNTGNELVSVNDSLFYYQLVASDDDIDEYIDLLDTIAQDLEDPTKAIDYLDEAPTLVYSGNTSPSNDIGKYGDYYLDTNTSKIYGPKLTDTTWV